jgi:hypothetical protein
VFECLLGFAERVLPGYYSPAMVAPQVGIRASGCVSEGLLSFGESWVKKCSVDCTTGLCLSACWVLGRGFCRGITALQWLRRRYDLGLKVLSFAEFCRELVLQRVSCRGITAPQWFHPKGAPEMKYQRLRTPCRPKEFQMPSASTLHSPASLGWPPPSLFFPSPHTPIF